jgi:allophanate hydrolase subunit 2
LPYPTAVRDDRRGKVTVNREDAVVASHDESHYARAKYLVGRKAKRIGPRVPGDRLRDATDQEIAQAQVHATLALVDVMRELTSELAAGRQREPDGQA